MPDTAAAPDGEGVFLVTNSRSGQAVVRADPLPRVRERLARATVHELGEDESLDDAVTAAMAAEHPPRVLGVLGGDGSVSRLAHLARRHDVPLLVIPGGTFNHFARAAGLDDPDAALDAFASGQLRDVAVAEVTVDDGEPITVLNAVSLGAYPQFLAERERRGALGKWLGGVVAIQRELRGARPIRIRVGDRRARIWSVFVSVGRNDPDRHAMMQRSGLNDAVLDVRVHHARGTRVRAMASLAFGRRTIAVLRALRLMPRSSDLERFVEQTWEVRVQPDDAPPVYVHDGELEEADPAGFTLRVRAIPAALRVYAP
ncbi:diacylglycerol/lipid kinase family protein [Microbacterium sp. RD1]|uniref:diacylglycerol/lipid kinase family protein n=1 Tax=Microbacterium sp. RD1 TaxID=3457313 RepID=UPI003FA54634